MESTKKQKRIPKLGPVTQGSDWTELKQTASENGKALFEDTDAGNYTNDNAQSVYLGAPLSVGNSQDQYGYSALLNNVLTDTGRFLQNGFLFSGGNGSAVYTDDNYSYSPQYYSMYFNAGDTYWTDITYTSGAWWMCEEDIAYPSLTYTCIPDNSITGTNLAPDPNTSVWAENANVGGSWYQGFSSPWRAWGAMIYINGVGQNWSSEHHHTSDACSTSWSPTNALNSSLIGCGTGYFILSGIPPYC